MVFQYSLQIFYITLSGTNLIYRILNEARDGRDVTGADIKLARNACYAPSVLTHWAILQFYPNVN